MQTLVSVPTFNTMYHPQIFEVRNTQNHQPGHLSRANNDQKPEEYSIDRWLQPNAGELLEYFHPFSLGPRSCIGRR